MRVTPYRKTGDFARPVADIDHTIFLAAVSADGPARCKLAKWLQSSAYMGCGWCVFNGSMYQPPAKRGMYFWGYVEAVSQCVGRLAGTAQKALRVAFRLTHHQQMERAEDVKAGRQTPQEAGCNGVALFPKVTMHIIEMLACQVVAPAAAAARAPSARIACHVWHAAHATRAARALLIADCGADACVCACARAF